MKRAGLVAIAALGLVAIAAQLGACSSPPPPPPPPGPARVSVSVMRGLPVTGLDVPEPHAFALVDAGSTMAARDFQGVSHLAAAQAAALRWLDAMPETIALELRAVGGVRGSRCDAPARRLGGGGAMVREALYAELDRLTPVGDGSVAEALFELANDLPADPAPVRVVAWTALRDTCGASLCEAARQLTKRGARLDLVLLGGAEAPPCLADLELESAPLTPPPPRPPVPFRVELVGDDPAVIASSEAGGLPVALLGGEARVRVGLEPPLVVGREFEPGSRWVLEVIDFPALDLGERQWRWREIESGEEPAAQP